jgi:hypothetical protein
LRDLLPRPLTKSSAQEHSIDSERRAQLMMGRILIGRICGGLQAPTVNKVHDIKRVFSAASCFRRDSSLNLNTLVRGRSCDFHTLRIVSLYELVTRSPHAEALKLLKHIANEYPGSLSSIDTPVSKLQLLWGVCLPKLDTSYPEIGIDRFSTTVNPLYV